MLWLEISSLKEIKLLQLTWNALNVIFSPLFDVSTCVTAFASSASFRLDLRDRKNSTHTNCLHVSFNVNTIRFLSSTLAEVWIELNEKRKTNEKKMSHDIIGQTDRNLQFSLLSPNSSKLKYRFSSKDKASTE